MWQFLRALCFTDGNLGRIFMTLFSKFICILPIEYILTLDPNEGKIHRWKFLRCHCKCNLSWAHHVSGVCSKMSYYLHLLSSHRHVIDYSLMKMLLEFLHGVFSSILLCSGLGSLPWKHVTLLQRLQRM